MMINFNIQQIRSFLSSEYKTINYYINKAFYFHFQSFLNLFQFFAA